MINQPLSQTDPEIAAVLRDELRRQNEGLELIASENFTSRAVMEAMGSVLTNKYAEGLPGKRYYGGCEYVDVAEQLAIDRAKELFQAPHANVQPHSGAQANQAVFLAALQPGDTIMGMNLSHGGHLTHGSPVNLSGLWFKVVQYGVNTETGTIDYDELARVAREHRPKLIIAGASAYPRVIDFARFRAVADEVGALLMVDMAHIAGLVAAGIHPSPMAHAQYTTTTTHKTLRGPRGGIVFCQAEYAKALDKAVFPGLQGGPLMHVIAAKAVALKEALQPDFRDYQQQIVRNAQALAAALAAQGVPLISGGTDNHLMLVDLKGWPISGKEAEEALGAVGITVNKNAVPNDPRKPFVTSGLRIGTPAVTTRGLKESHMTALGETIAAILHAPQDEAVRGRARQLVAELCAAFPLYDYQRSKQPV